MTNKDLETELSEEGMSKVLPSDRGRWWALGGAVIGLVIGFGIIIPSFYNLQKESERKQNLIQKVKDNPLYHSTITIVKRDYIVSDLDGNGEEDTIYTLLEEVPKSPWNIYHEEHVFTKGDSDFERVLSEAKSARIYQEEK